MEELIEYYEMEVSNSHGTWYEKLEPTKTRTGITPAPKNDAEAYRQAQDTIDFFNSSLRQGEEPRELESVRKVEILKTYRDL